MRACFRSVLFGFIVGFVQEEKKTCIYPPTACGYGVDWGQPGVLDDDANHVIVPETGQREWEALDDLQPALNVEDGVHNFIGATTPT